MQGVLLYQRCWNIEMKALCGHQLDTFICKLCMCPQQWGLVNFWRANFSLSNSLGYLGVPVGPHLANNSIRCMTLNFKIRYVVILCCCITNYSIIEYFIVFHNTICLFCKVSCLCCAAIATQNRLIYKSQIL